MSEVNRASTEEKTEKIVGVSINMSQREPRIADVTREGKRAKEWRYGLFGHFDEMQITIVDSMKKFSLRTLYDGLAERAYDERVYYHPEIRQVFLYADDVGTTEDLLIEKFADKDGEGAEFPFVGLIAVKLRSQFVEKPRKCDPRKCINRFLKKRLVAAESRGTRGIVYCVPKSLGLDDVYVLINASHPDDILECERWLMDLQCDFKCELVDVDAVKSIAEKSIKKLTDLKGVFEDLLRENKYDMSIKDQNTVNEIIDNYMNELKEVEKTGKHFDFAETKRLVNAFDDFKEKQKLPFFVLNFIFGCVETARACGILPGVLHTHSIIGVKNSLTSEGLPGYSRDRKANVEIQIRLRPGVDWTDFVEKLNESVGEDLKKEPFLMAAGRYDVTWRPNLTIGQFIDLYTNPILNTAESELIQHSSAHFAFEYKSVDLISGDAEKAKETAELKTLLFKEEDCLAQRWVSEEQRKAADLFSEISSKYEIEFPFLHRIINEVSRLHAYGCRRIFNALTWNEFDNARRFFEVFFERLKKEFESFDKTNGEERINYANMIYKSMDLFKDAMSDIFNERIVLDQSMYENTRVGVYATGAYEAALKFYTGWILDLRELLSELESKESENPGHKEHEFDFLLVPIETGEIHTRHLFPMSKNNGTLVFFYASFESMINFDMALSMFAHEVGHYLGIIERENRVKSYFNRVSYLSACEMEQYFWSMKKNPDMDRETLDMYRKEFCGLQKILDEYYNSHLSEMRKSEEPDVKLMSYYLDYISVLCRDWCAALVEKLKDPTKKKSSLEMKVKEEWDRLFERFKLKEEGISYNQIFERFEALTGTAAKFCQLLVRECYADSIMIHVGNFCVEEYLDVLLIALKERDGGPRPDDDVPDKNLSHINYIDGTRVISAMMQIEIREEYRKNPDGFFSKERNAELIKNVREKTLWKINSLIFERKSSKTSAWMEALLKKHGVISEHLSKAVDKLIDTVDHDIHSRKWFLGITDYALSTGMEILKRLENLDGNVREKLGDMRGLYSAIKNKETDLEQLCELFDK